MHRTMDTGVIEEIKRITLDYFYAGVSAKDTNPYTYHSGSNNTL